MSGNTVDARQLAALVATSPTTVTRIETGTAKTYRPLRATLGQLRL